ncbi:MAG: MFS transporter [Anaerolineaceae bacterium]|nr:MFS transporter [Anaerolineaceae bacterium]
MPSLSRAKLNFNVGLFSFSRLAINTSLRMVYPFIAIFASGMHVDVSMISLALAISMITSAAAPFLAPIADQRGRKSGMLIGLLIYLAGVLAAALFPSYLTFLFSILLGNLGNNLFAPALQAYLGDHVPYEKRGLYLTITEIPWALSFILMIPLIGVMLTHLTWYSPFWLLAGLAVLMFVLIAVFVPSDRPASAEAMTFFADIKKVLTSRSALFGMVMGFLIVAGNEVVNVVFGVWIQDSFGLEIAALGAASAIIGFSELTGEGITAYLADHLGKERAVTLGLILSSLAVITLPWLGRSEVGALIWLFLFYFTFEIMVVSSLPLMTEVMPAARATMMALFLAALSLGRAAGDLLAPTLYQTGFWLNAAACLVFNVLAWVALSRVKLPSSQKEPPLSAGD